jgi:serine O-acetyltransferase
MGGGRAPRGGEMSEQQRHVAHQPRVSPMFSGEANLNPEGLSLLSLMAEDYRTHDRDLMEPGLWAVLIHRFGNWRMDVRPKLLRIPFTLIYRLLFRVVALGFGINLPYNVRLGRRVRIWHHGGIFIGARSIGDDVHLRHNVTVGVLHRDEEDAKAVIGSRVDIMAGAVIVGPIEVGDDVVIGANSVVVKDVPAGSTVFGVPARAVGSFSKRKD